MRVLAISGSLRAASINAAVPEAAARLAPAGVAADPDLSGRMWRGLDALRAAADPGRRSRTTSTERSE